MKIQFFYFSKDLLSKLKLRKIKNLLKMDTHCLKISLVDDDENLEMFEVSEVEDESQECDDYLEINEIDAFR